MKTGIIFIAIALLVSSCATTTRTTTAKRMDIYGSGVIQYPVIGELEVSENKVTGSATSTRAQAVISIRNHAIADAIRKANADVLIEPVFESVSSDGKTTVTVTGFPAVYKNFRPITAEDIPMLEAGILQFASIYESQETEKNYLDDQPTREREKISGGNLWIGLGGAALLVIMAFLLN